MQGIDNKLNKYLNPDFWENCINGHRNLFAKQKQSYFKLLNNHPGGIYSELKNLIKSKLDLYSKELKTGAISTTITERKQVQFPQYIRMESAPIHSKCIVTCLPIHNQQSGSKYISSKGVRWYYENNSITYKNSLETLLTDKWLRQHKGESIEVYFDEIYHQIRNKGLNPKNNLERDLLNLKNKGPKLFPTIDLLAPEKLRLIKNEPVEI